MRPDRGGDRWVAAVGLVGVPLLVLVLPAVLRWGEDYSTPEEQFTAMAEAPAAYGNVFVQAAGSLCLMGASLGVLGVVTRHRRGVALGWLNVVLGVLSAAALLLALGAEIALVTMLSNAPDKGVAVALALGVNSAAVFLTLLWSGLAGVFLVPLLCALALWRAGVVSVIVALLFLLPVVIGFVPLPAQLANLAPALVLLIPTGWMAARLVSGYSSKPSPAAAAASALPDRGPS